MLKTKLHPQEATDQSNPQENQRNVFGEVCFRAERRKRQKLLLIELLQDYAKHSTLHGLRYITESGVSFVEKSFWIFTFIISVVMCFLLIRNVWIKWTSNPILVTFSERFVPVGMVPFPSVTICPQIKSMSTKYNFSQEYGSYYSTNFSDIDDLWGPEPDKELKRCKIDDVALVCNLPYYEPLTNKTYGNSTAVENIREVSPTVNDTFVFCKLRDKDLYCHEIFKEVLTREGVCFNFNALAAEEIFKKPNIQHDYDYLLTRKNKRNWTLTGGYESYDPDAYPTRGMENGGTPDLEIILKENFKERDGLCNSYNRGFKIYVQHPSDVPQSSLYYYAALPKQVSSLALKFTMLTTADSLLNYEPNIRQCYFPKDRPLRYFNMYSANNCRLECQSNYTFEKCGCVMFDMPHYDSQRICTVNSKACVIKALDELRKEELKAEKDLEADACRCFPDCHSVTYDAEILKTDYDIKSFIRTYENIYKYADSGLDEDVEFSKIDIYFKEPRFISLRRSELFGPTDFLANCGGLLGLFLGFSFLSLVEIFYFITLRVFYTFKRDLKKEKRERNFKTI